MFAKFFLFMLLFVGSVSFAQSTQSTPSPEEMLGEKPIPKPPTAPAGTTTNLPPAPSSEKTMTNTLITPAAEAKPKKKKKRLKGPVDTEPEDFEKEPEPAKPLIERAADYLQGPQEGMSDRVIVLANEVDRLFGTTRALDEYYESSLRIYQTSYVNSKGSGSYDISTNLNLSLPNWKDTEKKFQNWWNGPQDDEGKVTQKEFKEANPWEFNQGVNLRFSRPVAYGALARVSKNFLTGDVVNHFYQQVGWDSDRLWESVTSLTNDYALDRKLLFRFLDEADWGISDEKFNSYHGPSLIYTINRVSLTSFDLRLITIIEDNNLYTDNYTAGITYRTAVLPLNWLFVQITPELSWPRREHFTATWTMYFEIEIVFGSVKQ
ncbi:hypothetical protein [Bdellovibrio sp. NC01]|uniref:hypothetical protein n=1 Tax=Bdellovibrio sp. NC01 TaxID=2220073 RepID=UPI00115B0C0C|nr:hypothetical protein [Bdellovibrio sp. NC01]